jgi:SAM-dependent methyltransferase
MEIWNSFWYNKHNQPILENPPKVLYGGTNIEPLASMGMCCFLDPSRDKFKEGFSVLDYGCGAGILSNFISERLSEFNYYGLEPNSQHGMERISLAKHNFNDERLFFGLIDTNLEHCLNQKLDSIILISVFTHLLIDDITAILDNLIKVFDKNTDCNIVFSCFTSYEDKVENFQPHIWERFYGTSHIKESDLIKYCDKNNLKINKHMSFTAQGGHIHEIFKIEKIW